MSEMMGALEGNTPEKKFGPARLYRNRDLRRPATITYSTVSRDRDRE